MLPAGQSALITRRRYVYDIIICYAARHTPIEIFCRCRAMLMPPLDASAMFCYAAASQLLKATLISPRHAVAARLRRYTPPCYDTDMICCH